MWAIDKEYATSRMTIETYRKKISEIFDNLEVIAKEKMGGCLSRYVLTLMNV